MENQLSSMLKSQVIFSNLLKFVGYALVPLVLLGIYLNGRLFVVHPAFLMPLVIYVVFLITCANDLKNNRKSGLPMLFVLTFISAIAAYTTVFYQDIYGFLLALYTVPTFVALIIAFVYFLTIRKNLSGVQTQTMPIQSEYVDKIGKVAYIAGWLATGYFLFALATEKSGNGLLGLPLILGMYWWIEGARAIKNGKKRGLVLFGVSVLFNAIVFGLPIISGRASDGGEGWVTVMHIITAIQIAFMLYFLTIRKKLV